jgi:anthranilate synthase component 1
MTETIQEPRTRIRVNRRELAADTLTPVTLYLNLRDHYRDPVLLESNDAGNPENAYSFVGLDTIAALHVKDGELFRFRGDELRDRQPVTDVDVVPAALNAFLRQFDLMDEATDPPLFNGLIGHTNFDGVQYFDTLRLDPKKKRFDQPDLRYHLYRFIIAIDHFRDRLYILENQPEEEESQIDQLIIRILGRNYPVHPFSITGEESSNLTDEEYRELVRLGQHHCHIGDVFQIVLSRHFEQPFLGDDFQVYRALRSINPSPYLFYFDYGDYRILGSSPEAQLVIRNGVARLNPIAGTYRRTGNFQEDQQGAQDLLADPKENAEHIMLVDLARNDLSRHTRQVRVSSLKDIHFYSHVIHIVSTVEGDLPANANPVRIFGDTFPAGTLSGAPKYKAIELIDRYENQRRGFYGGGLGFINFNGDMNQAIVIRSFLSRNNRLHYQAGAGIVAASDPESELQEVNNKLRALKRALALAADL